MFDCDVKIPLTPIELSNMLADPSAQILAGGTDILPRLRRNGIAKPLILVDISQLHDLSYIRERHNLIEIGALTTHSKLVSSPLLMHNAPALVKACASIGSAQTRARGTLGGNLCNASPAADSTVPLLCLDAVVTIAALSSQRQVPLQNFLVGPGQTCLEESEYLDHISFAIPQPYSGTSFIKLGRRNGMAIAVASAAALLRLDQNGMICTARVALGSVAPTPIRSKNAEAALVGRIPGIQVFKEAAHAMLTDIHPIDDLRASKDYRLHSAEILLQRALQTAWQQAKKDLQ